MNKVLSHEKPKAVEDSLGGWSGSKSLIMASDQEILVVQATVGKPDSFTAQFFLGGAEPPFVGANNAIRALAEILWTVQGNTVRRLVSVVNGMSITGRADNFNLKVFDASAAPSNPTFVTYPVSALVSRGQRAGTPNPPYLYQNVNAGAVRGAGIVFGVPSGVGAGTLINVPQNVGVNSVWLDFYIPSVVPVVPANIGNNEVWAVQHTAGAVGTVTTGNYSVFNQWWPIGPGCELIRIQNLTAAIGVNTGFVTPTWGIDG